MPAKVITGVLQDTLPLTPDPRIVVALITSGAGLAVAGTVRSVPELISPTARLRDSWLASRGEWGRDVHQDGAGLRAGDDVN